jgi:hypothetical protein
MVRQLEDQMKRYLLKLAGGAVAAFLVMPHPSMAKTVTLAMTVTLDQVAPEDAKMYRVGGRDLDRIAYDDTKVDPATHKVPVTLLAHYIGGRWFPVEGADASSLNLDTYRLDLAAAVEHGRPLIALFESGEPRMAMLARPDFHVLIAGRYVIDPRPLTPQEVSAPPPGWDGPDIMPMMSGMPHMPPKP